VSGVENAAIRHLAHHFVGDAPPLASVRDGATAAPVLETLPRGELRSLRGDAGAEGPSARVHRAAAAHRGDSRRQHFAIVAESTIEREVRTPMKVRLSAICLSPALGDCIAQRLRRDCRTRRGSSRSLVTLFERCRLASSERTMQIFGTEHCRPHGQALRLQGVPAGVCGSTRTSFDAVGTGRERCDTSAGTPRPSDTTTRTLLDAQLRAAQSSGLIALQELIATRLEFDDASFRLGHGLSHQLGVPMRVFRVPSVIVGLGREGSTASIVVVFLKRSPLLGDDGDLCSRVGDLLDDRAELPLYPALRSAIAEHGFSLWSFAKAVSWTRARASALSVGHGPVQPSKGTAKECGKTRIL